MDLQALARSWRLYRHRYVYEIEWALLEHLLERIAAVHQDLRRDLLAFADTVSALADGMR